MIRIPTILAIGSSLALTLSGFGLACLLFVAFPPPPSAYRTLADPLACRMLLASEGPAAGQAFIFIPPRE